MFSGEFLLMLRNYQAILSRLYILLDAAMTIFAWLIAWLIRFKTNLLPQQGHLLFSNYISILAVAVPVFLIGSGVLGLYGTTRISRLRRIALQIFKSDVAMALFVIGLLYYEEQLNYSRAVLIMFVLFTWVFVFAGRFVVRSLMEYARSRGFNQKYLLLIGMTNTTQIFLRSLHHQMELGYKVLGYLTADTDNSPDSTNSHGTSDLYDIEDVAVAGDLAVATPPLQCLGSVRDLDKVLHEHIIDHVVMTMRGTDGHVLRHVMAVAESHGVHAMLVPDFIEILPSRPRFDEFAGLPIIDTRYTPLDEAINIVIKRTFDIVFSLLVLIIGSPVLLFLALMVKISSPGPIIFSQERLGKNRRRFHMYKFRTMYHSDPVGENEGWTVPGDPRRTSIGRFLRRTSLDELPQFFNVLRGDMSVIGPRPERPIFAEQFRDDIPRYMIKHRVRPGITGWAQVNGLRGDTSIEDRIEYDLRYIEEWTFSWDLRIVMLTLIKGFRDKNAY